MYLQVWNGIEINSTTFGRTVEWRGGGVFGNHSGVKAIIIKKITIPSNYYQKDHLMKTMDKGSMQSLEMKT